MLAIHRTRSFKGSTNITVADALTSLAFNELLEHLIQFTEKLGNGKGSLKGHNGAPKHGLKWFNSLPLSAAFTNKVRKTVGIRN